MVAEAEEVTIRVVESATDVDAVAWNRLANPVFGPTTDYDYNPFLSHAFFDALEKSDSASREEGWLAQHLVMQAQIGSKREVIGVLPCYLKNHSQGEYVFDHGWADAYERAGGSYYPKLQATVPFTPATGRRLFVGEVPDADKRRLMLAGGLQEICDRLGVSSAHITFMSEHEWDLLGEQSFLKRTDQQFHWLNDGYADFDEFLAALSSRKRKNIRKERAAALADNGITIEWLTGNDLTEDIWDIFYRFYMDTGSRKWGRPYLTREFYSMIGEALADDIVLVMAKRNHSYVAGAINFVGSHRLFGRHWGCVEDHPFLHFEVCYYNAIDYAIAHKLERVEAGAQGPHKLARGYMPQITHSAHFLPNPSFRRAVEDYLEHERHAVERESEAIARHGPFRKENQ
ncbi:MAG: GNAT family N-acetyltransferase [Rhizobiaceae bacterium]